MLEEALIENWHNQQTIVPKHPNNRGRRDARGEPGMVDEANSPGRANKPKTGRDQRWERRLETSHLRIY
jgi:hypothetical protein